MADWWVLSIAVALLSFFIAVLLHMVSISFDLKSLNMWVKGEYMQVAVSFLIIFFAAAMVTAGNAAISTITVQVAAASGNIELTHAAQNALGDPFNIAKAYIKAVISCERWIYLLLYWINVYVETFSKISLDVLGVEGIGGGLALTGFVTLFHYLMNNILYLVLYHFIQYNILYYSQYTMLPVFLPIGLVLRAFPLTRGAGGFVTAFALGFAFVFPMTYVIIVAIMPNVSVPCAQVTLQAQPENIPFGPNEPCFSGMSCVFENYYKLKSQQQKLGGIVDFAQSTISILFLQALFYPLAALIMVFSFIRQTGNLLGADLAEIGRGLVKII